MPKIYTAFHIENDKTQPCGCRTWEEWYGNSMASVVVQECEKHRWKVNIVDVKEDE